MDAFARVLGISTQDHQNRLHTESPTVSDRRCRRTKYHALAKMKGRRVGILAFQSTSRGERPTRWPAIGPARKLPAPSSRATNPAASNNFFRLARVKNRTWTVSFFSVA